MNPFDSQKISMSCPKCSREFQETIGRLRNSPDVTCAGCGESIHINATDLDKQLRGVEKSLGDLGRKLSKTIKI